MIPLMWIAHRLTQIEQIFADYQSDVLSTKDTKDTD